MFIDKLLRCRDCKADFLFTAGEQLFFGEKGLTNEPKRCNNCRVIVRLKRNGEDISNVSPTRCMNCEAPVVVPFKPDGRKPIYCFSCLRSNTLIEPVQTLSIAH